MNKIIQGDALTKLKELPEKSINMCMTSPPYWALRDYGTATWKGGDKNCNHKKGDGSKKSRAKSTIGYAESQGHNLESWGDYCRKCGAKRIDKQLGLEPNFNEYINSLCDIFDEVKRVLRDDGTCWVNLGDTYAGGGSGQKKDTGKHGYAPEIMNANKHIKYNNKVLVGDVKLRKRLENKNLVLIPFHFAIEMQNRGWILRNVIIWHKPNCMPSSAKDRFTVDFEYLFFFSKKKKYYFEAQYEKLSEASLKDFNSRKTFRNKGSNNVYSCPGEGRDRREFYNVEKGRNKRTTWSFNTKPFKEAHFAVYPEELCETPIKAGCPKGGIVLDPFFGSGTTGLVALKQNKKFIGIELNPEYLEIINKRLKPFIGQEKL